MREKHQGTSQGRERTEVSAREARKMRSPSKERLIGQGSMLHTHPAPGSYYYSERESSEETITTSSSGDRRFLSGVLQASSSNSCLDLFVFTYRTGKHHFLYLLSRRQGKAEFKKTLSRNCFHGTSMQSTKRNHDHPSATLGVVQCTAVARMQKAPAFKEEGLLNPVDCPSKQ